MVVLHRMPLSSAGASLLADDDPLLLHRQEAELRGDMQCTAVEVYLSPLRKGRMINHTYASADLKDPLFSFKLKCLA